MRSIVLAVLFSCVLFSAAEARPRAHQIHQDCNVTMPCEGVVTSARGQRVILAQRGFGSAVKTYTPSLPSTGRSSDIGSRPSRWCGWFMQHETGVTSKVTGRNLNMAREWAHVGSNAGGPRVGAIVVWRHHVGKIVGQASDGQWIVRSGNDGRAVRERPRSVAGAIAFRVI